MAAALPHPTSFLEVRVVRGDVLPPLTAVCAGYEQGEWRCKQLASHLVQWIPEFALRERERAAIASHNAVELLYRAASLVYSTNKTETRGEIGELLLHAILRQTQRTVPAISKFFYKDSANDTVKGFDAVHVVVQEDSLELWLGEVKFYADIESAIASVVAELEVHSRPDYLRREFALICNKIDDGWPHADRLRKLLHPNTSLDEIFSGVCVPVLLTYDSSAVGAFDHVCEEFLQAFKAEVLVNWERFRGKNLSKRLRVHLFLFPMKSKLALVEAFDERLKACQATQ